MLVTRAWFVAVEAERIEVLLAEHVVEVDARAGRDHPDPEPFEQVTLAALPSPSSTEM